MRFEWDELKNKRNYLKHGIRFQTAALVFDDPVAMTMSDETSHDEDRCRTIGAVAAGALVFVAHSWCEEDGEDIIRMISARAASRKERKAYEETQQGATKRDRRHQSKDGRRN